MTEIWKDIPGYEGWYQVSSLGRIKSLARTVNYGSKSVRSQGESVLVPRNSGNPLGGKYYQSVILCRNKERRQFKVHRLVATAFVKKPQDCDVVNHLDNNPENNIAGNLEWTTINGNNQHRHLQGRSSSAFGSFTGSAKLAEAQIPEIRKMLFSDVSQQTIASYFGVSQSSVSRIKCARTWSHACAA